MEKLKKIPVIGYILRVIIAVCKLPKHIDNLYQVLGEHREDNLEAIKRLQEQNDKLQMQCEEALKENQNLQVQCEELKRWNADRMCEIQKLQLESMELHTWNVDRMKEIQELDMRTSILNDLKELNRRCSEQPTIWGDKERLKISALAAVNSCMFNTNSGKIIVGDYTFAGSGVSILAGSHDIRLRGLLRRDVEITDNCDIEIGKGVWLASNSTVLGPAKIKDNAVVAAGAVVTPNTCIEENEIYAGIPAKKIGNIAYENKKFIDTDTCKAALERTKGVLFVKGWTDKKAIFLHEKEYIGHYWVGKTAEIITSREKIELFYCSFETVNMEISVVCNGQRRIYSLKENEGTITLAGAEGKRTTLVLERNWDNCKLFFAISA